MKDYEKLFKCYVQELDSSVTQEEDKLDAIRARMSIEGKTESEIEEFIRQRFDPICCSGRVIATFRKFWFQCHKLNLYNDINDIKVYVNPKEFTVDWLMENRNPYELFDVIEGMPYYPIGIDENGEYC